MRKKKKTKLWLYQKYLSEHEIAEEVNEISKEVGAEKENIVINKVSTLGKALEIIRDCLFTVGKVAFWIMIMGLLSIGGTVLINEELRKVLFELLRNVL